MQTPRPRRLTRFFAAPVRRVAALAAAVTWACALPVLADTAYPARDVRLLVGFAAGGATDSLARYYAKKLTDKFGQSFVVENKPGNGGNIAIKALTQSTPDGYTIAMGANFIVSGAAFGRSPFNWDTDLAPIAMIVATPNVVAVPAGSPIKSIADIVRMAAPPARSLTYATAGMGSSQHLAGELFAYRSGAQLTHVPYKGGSQAIIDLLAGRVDLTFGSSTTIMPAVDGGKLTLLAVTGPDRMRQYPNVPTIAESGLPGYDVQADYLMVAPAGTPASIVEKLAIAIDEISRDPESARVMDRLYAIPLFGGPKETRQYLEREFLKWQALERATHLKID